MKDIFLSTGAYDATKTPDLVGATSFASMITRLMPNGQAPLFGLSSMLKEATAVQFEHGYFAKTMLFPSATINEVAGYAAGITVFTVDSTDEMVPGMLLRTASGENVLVLGVTDATTMTVRRQVGTVVAGTIADNEVLYQVGNVSEEASNAPLAMSLTPQRITNLTHIFRNSWALSGSVAATDVIAGDSHIAENRQDCAAFHAVDIEKATFFSQKYSGTLNNKPLRTMDGLINIIQTYAPANIFTAGATTNATELEAMLDPVFDVTTDPKYSNERVLFVGSQAKIVINNIGKKNGTYQLIDGQTSWGLQFDTFKTARGTFRLIEHPLFNSNIVWAKMAVAVDLPTFSIAYLKGRKTKSKEYNADGKEATDNAIDATGGTLTTECTTEVRNPSANCVIFGLTAAAVG